MLLRFTAPFVMLLVPPAIWEVAIRRLTKWILQTPMKQCGKSHSTSPKGKRIETRFPDPTANPYLGFAALLMAGMDGILNKIHPGDPMDKNLYDLPPAELAEIPTVSGSLREALECLDADRAFLKAGNVFSDDLIDAYIELKMEEVERTDMTPHPVEFDMYYSV